REDVDVQAAVESQGGRRARGDEDGTACAVVGGASCLGVAAEEYFEVVAVVETAGARGYFPRAVEVGWAVDVDDAAEAGNHLGIGGGGCDLPARGPAEQHESIGVDAEGSRVLAQEADGREQVVALGRPDELRREAVIDRGHRVSEPREPVVEPALG